MMLYVLGSSSHGNCYLLYNESEILIIEAGIPFKELNRLPFFDLRKVVGCIITHEHGDHAGRINEYLDYGINCYASAGTIENIKLISARIPLMTESGHTFHLGKFSIATFDTEHDAAEPIGFVINHSNSGPILFATDTYYLRYKFPGLNHILIECNYQKSILDANFEAGKIDIARRNRTLLSHMELETCIAALKANNLSLVRNIVLLHLSDQNSNEKEFVKRVTEDTHRLTTAARPGIFINLDKESF